MVNDSKENAPRGKKGLTDEQRALRVKVMSFFLRLQTDLGLSGLTKNSFEEIRKEINRKTGEDRCEDTIFKRLKQKNPDIRQELFEQIMLAIPSVSVWQKNPQVWDLYGEIFGIPFSELAPNRAIFNFQRDDKLALTEIDNILGDYLLYRAEAVPSGKKHLVSRAFFRFYKHRNGHIRSMGLWLDKKHSYLSSKGWVVNPDHYHLMVSHIVDRIGPNLTDIRRGGGATMMTVRYAEPNRFTIINHEGGIPRIQCAPVMHFRATNSTEPSFSKGVLLRLFGVENRGGNEHTDKSKRYAQIRRLQEDLSEKCKHPLTLHQAAAQLAKATRFHKNVFFQKSNEHNLPSGLLVNRPTLTIRTDDINNGEFLPDLVIGATEFEDDSSRSDTQRPREAAGIHFDEIDI